MKFNEEFIHINVPVKHLVTFNIGGNADYFYSADSIDALCGAVNYAKKSNIPFFILGGGSNLVVSDKGIEGLVIHNQCEDIC
ncbi:MAG: FAD-binding protein, partial [Candidatus Riflebacteria bacterium]|nr:FAD-binding protein [Candidatus Riflebacteria bacterium]